MTAQLVQNEGNAGFGRNYGEQAALETGNGWVFFNREMFIAVVRVWGRTSQNPQAQRKYGLVRSTITERTGFWLDRHRGYRHGKIKVLQF